MNIRNYRKYFTKWNVQTSTNTKDDFGGIVVGTVTREIEGYLSKSMTNTRDTGNGIPTTRSGGILFTYPDVLLVEGDILDNQYQIIDSDKHASHNEYSVKFIEKWGNEVSPLPAPDIDILTEEGDIFLTEEGDAMIMEQNY